MPHRWFLIFRICIVVRAVWNNAETWQSTSDGEIWEETKVKLKLPITRISRRSSSASSSGKSTSTSSSSLSLLFISISLSALNGDAFDDGVSSTLVFKALLLMGRAWVLSVGWPSFIINVARKIIRGGTWSLEIGSLQNQYKNKFAIRNTIWKYIFDDPRKFTHRRSCRKIQAP